MPTVDFTLEDVRKIIRSEVPKIIIEIVPKIIDERVPAIIDRRVPELFNDFYDTNFAPVFESMDDQFDDLRSNLEEMRAELKGIRRIVRKHSSDIAELQADQGL